MEVKNAPYEITNLMGRVNEQFMRVQRAKRQLDAWKHEEALADASFKAVQAEYHEALNRWDTVSDTLAPKVLENAPVENPAK